MHEVYIVELEKSLKELKIGNPLIPKSFLLDNVLSKCGLLLVKNNYAVVKKPRAALKVTNIKGLVDLYYHILTATTTLIPYRNDKTDIPIAKSLIKHVQESTGLNYELSLVACINIVEGLFLYKKQLNLNPEIMTTFRVFGQDKLGWITEKIIYLRNKDANDDAILIARADADTKAYAERHDVQFGWDDLEELANKIGD
jgi:hypothetical protein